MFSRELLLALGFASLVVAAPAPASVADPARDPVVLEGNPDVARLKIEMIGETARLERREIAERARAARRARLRRGRVAAPRSAPRGLSMHPHFPVDGGPSSNPSPLEVFASVQPQNVLVNDKTGDGLYSAQSEAAIALLDPNGLAAWNDGQGIETGLDTQCAGVTTSGGATWTKVAIPHPSGAPAAYWKSDPTVTVNARTGDFFYAGLTNGVGTTDNGLAVVRGRFTGGAFAWDPARVVRNATASSLLFDKPWIVADSSSGRLFLTYTTFGSSTDSIKLQVSSDLGVSWSNPVTVNLTGFGRVQGARPAVGPGGELYVTWQETGVWAADSIRCRRSLDHGSSFGAAAAVAAVYGNFGTGAPGFNRPQGFTMPSIAVDRTGGPSRGRVYVAWSEAVNYYDDPLGGGGARNEIEPDGNFAAATPFVPGQKLRGTISTQLDLDYWSFSAIQGKTYIFYCDSVAKWLSYYMRVFCGTDSSTRLAFSGSPQSRGRTGLIVWTAPSSGTYYLRLAPSDTIGGYRVQTGVDAPSAGERARDQRDAFVSGSADGLAWSAPVRVNDDPAGLDDWLPELAVSSEGYPYATWLDWRDATANCGGQSNLYTTRSLDGGASWAANQRVSSASSAWSFVAANVAPNQGDYLGLSGGSTMLFAWADGRLGDADVWSSSLAVRGRVSVAPPDSTWTPGTSHTLPFTVANPNLLFASPSLVTLSGQRAWPGLPVTSGPFPVPAGGTYGINLPVSVPDTAASGTNALRLVLQQANGIRLDSVTVTITIGRTAGVEGPRPPGLALRGAWPNPAAGELHVSFTLPRLAPATLEILDLAGRRMRLREVGSLGPGVHVVDLTREAAGLRPGLYALRLAQGGLSETRKLAILH